MTHALPDDPPENPEDLSLIAARRRQTLQGEWEQACFFVWAKRHHRRRHYHRGAHLLPVLRH